MHNRCVNLYIGICIDCGVSSLTIRILFYSKILVKSLLKPYDGHNTGFYCNYFLQKLEIFCCFIVSEKKYQNIYPSGRQQDNNNIFLAKFPFSLLCSDGLTVPELYRIVRGVRTNSIELIL